MKKEKLIKALKNIIYVVLGVSIVTTSFSIYKNVTYTPIVVSGLSMSPTLKEGDFGYANKTTNALNNISREDVIIFHPSIDSESLYIKRVIALPNDIMFINSNSGEITINGEIISQEYISEELKLQTVKNGKDEFMDHFITLKDDEYFVLGDNRGSSLDSLHGIGFVNKDSIIGVLHVIVAKCDEDSYQANSRKVCNFNARNYYEIKDWKYF